MMHRGFRALCVASVMTVAGLIASTVKADIPYFNGFENANDVNAFTNNANSIVGSGITRVASGAGTYGYTAASGGFYGEIANTHDAYSTGYGDATYTRFGSSVPAYSGSFYESVAVYVDLAHWTPPTNASVPAFWIDASPSDNTTPANEYLDEVNFQISVPTAGTVTVGANGQSPFATITQSGWYTFKMTFAQGASGFAENDLSVSDASANQLGTTHHISTLPNSELGGNAYGDWTTVWQNGFAGDVIAIDEVQTGAVPEPASFGILGMAAAAMLRRRRALA